MLSLGRFQWQAQSNVLRQIDEPPTRRYFQLSQQGALDEIDQDSDEWLGFEDDDIEEEEEQEDFIPLENMKKWEANKPRGFGEGKVYDTSIEDKLMEEIEQSRKAQLLNLNRLKNKGMKPASKNQGSTDVEDGYQVRLLNLPKKKNIHRDLQDAFSGVPGILKILPVVSGNKKTRDPICKGLAFITFKYEDQAESFVQNFSGKGIVFGKVEKQIKCEVMSPMSLRDAASDHPLTEAGGSLQGSWDENSHSDDADLQALDEEDINDSSEPNIEDESGTGSLQQEISRGDGKKSKNQKKERQDAYEEQQHPWGSQPAEDTRQGNPYRRSLQIWKWFCCNHKGYCE